MAGTLVRPETPTDLLRISDLEHAQVEWLLRLAADMKANPLGWVETLPGRTLACFFEKPSTRTRVSFAAAAQRLGLLPLLLRPDELQLGRGEPIADTARVLSSYTAAIVIRTFAQETIDQVAAAADVPVVNALSDEHHPCQALADVLTLQERFGDLDGLRLAYVGDGNNVANSLVEIGRLTGIDVVVAAPAGFGPTVAGAHVVEDPREAVEGAHAVYTDVWVSMGEEAERAERLRELAPYQVDLALMAVARPEAVFLHCLPAHRGEEVADEVIDGPQSAVWQQAANRLPTEQALLYALISRHWGVDD
ncbi:MAG: ornithine carbamoyltransferase [Gaiellaceae bacterium]